VLIAEVLNDTGTLSDQSNWWIGEVIVPLMEELVAGADLCECCVRQKSHKPVHETTTDS
jgi:hypothetical protein